MYSKELVLASESLNLPLVAEHLLQGIWKDGGLEAGRLVLVGCLCKVLGLNKQKHPFNIWVCMDGSSRLDEASGVRCERKKN